MPTFRQRPLTWLFFIAAACWATAGAVRDHNSLALGSILSGQVYVVAAWAAVGKAHRLVRGAMLVVTPLAAAFVVHLLKAPADEVDTVLAFAIAASAGAFLSAGLTSLAIRKIVPAVDRRQGPWQISIAEILGWMVVAAIASVSASKAARTPLDLDFRLLWPIVVSTIPAGMMVALFLAPQPHYDRVATVVSAIAVGVYYFWSDWYGEGLYSTVYFFSFIAIWILAVRLDDQALAAKQELQTDDDARVVPTLRLHADSSQGE